MPASFFMNAKAVRKGLNQSRATVVFIVVTEQLCVLQNKMALAVVPSAETYTTYEVKL